MDPVSEEAEVKVTWSSVQLGDLGQCLSSGALSYAGAAQEAQVCPGDSPWLSTEQTPLNK